MTPTHRYRIGQILIDESARQIEHEGRILAVEPRIFDLIVYFCHHPGRAISQEELLDKVWGRSVASETVISQAVLKVRRILRCDDRAKDALVTLRGVGYRLDAGVAPAEDRPDRAPRLFAVRHRSYWLALPLTLVLLIAGPFLWPGSQPQVGIALFDIENATGDSQLEWVQTGGSRLMAEYLGSRGIDVLAGDRLDQLIEQAQDADSITTVLKDMTGVQQIYRPRLTSDTTGYRLELVGLHDHSISRMEISGAPPATLSLTLAELLADSLEAPRPDPEGRPGLGDPFLDEAYLRAFHHRQRGQFNDAKELYSYILRERPEAHWARYHLSITLRLEGDLAGAQTHLDSLVKAELTDDWLAAALHTSLGNVAWHAGELDRAESHYIQARERFAVHGSDSGVASTLGNLGMLAFSRADFDRGREFAYEALELFVRKDDYLQQSRLLHNIGNSYFEQGRLEQANELIQAALAIRNRLGLDDQAANTRSVLAEILIGQGRLVEAGQMLQQSLDVYEANGNVRGRATILADLAKLALKQGFPERAWDLASVALGLAREQNELANIAQFELILGRASHAAGDYFGAERHYRRSIQTWESFDHKPGQLTGLVERIRLALDRQQIEMAQQLLTQLNDGSNQLNDSRFRLQFRALSARLDLAKDAPAEVMTWIEETLELTESDRFARAGLTVELAEDLQRLHPYHPLLKRMDAVLADWAPHHFLAARLQYLRSESRSHCQMAADALRQLRGEDWARNLPDNPVCANQLGV